MSLTHPPPAEPVIEDTSNGTGSSSRRFTGKRSFLISLVRILILMVIACIAFGSGVAVQGYLLASRDPPSLEKLKNYEPPIVTQVFADNEEVIGEFYHARRYVVPLEDMPQAVVDAFVAGYGRDFWIPPCLDGKAILNAVRNMFTGRKPLFRIHARPLLRPWWFHKGSLILSLKKAMLHRRIRRELTEERILFLHMNQIYLGSNAYGVEAAARTYFGKSAKKLMASDCALIAGMVLSPREFSPKRNMDRALIRRNFVLRKMYEKGKLTKEEYEKAKSEKIVLAESKAVRSETEARYLERVRRYLVGKYGWDVVYTGGLKVYTTVHLPLTKADEQAISAPTACILRVVDRRGKLLEDHRRG